MATWQENVVPLDNRVQGAADGLGHRRLCEDLVLWMAKASRLPPYHDAFGQAKLRNPLETDETPSIRRSPEEHIDGPSPLIACGSDRRDLDSQYHPDR